MRILILSKDGDSLGIAHRLTQENNDVSMYIGNADYKHAGRGLVNRVAAWRPEIVRTDLIICDMVGFGGFEAVLRRSGKPIFSCSSVMDMAELDREKGIDLFKRSGIDIPFTQTYDNPSSAIELLVTWPETGYVIKPHGNQATGKTLLVRDREQFKWALDLYDDTITVQEIIKGVEVSTEGWFNGRSFIEPFNHTFEEKTLLPNAGPNTGCMGNVVINAGLGNRLVESTVARLEPFLKKIGYRGPIDVNTIVTSDKAYGLEVTGRLGYDAIEALTEGLQEPLTDLFFETAIGSKKRMELGSDDMIAVRLSTSPWPHDDPPEEDRGMPVAGITDDNLKHLFLTDIFKDNDYRYAASDGVLMKATAHGPDIKAARDRVYRTVNGIEYPNKQFRQDIGVRAISDIKQLKSWGWLNA